MTVINLSDYKKTKVSEESEGLEYLIDENSNIVGVMHDQWSFAIMRNAKKTTGIIDVNTGEFFGVLPSNSFNEILFAWLLLDDPSFIEGD